MVFDYCIFICNKLIFPILRKNFILCMFKTPHKKLKHFLKWIAILFSVFLSILFIIAILFNYYKDDIAKEVLLRVNKIQKGELIFEDISFNPFIHFPNVSLTLNAIDYYEYPIDNRDIDSIPIVKLDRLFIAFDVIELIKGNITVSDILLKNGKVNLITYADSSLNISNAFNIEADTTQNNQDTLSKEASAFELNLEKIKLINIEISYNHVSTSNLSTFYIHLLDASLSYSPKEITCFVNSNLTVDNAKLAITNKPIEIITSLSFNRVLNKITISPSKFSFDRANFSLAGYVDLNDYGFIDIKVNGGDNGLSILTLFMDNTVVDNIEQGNLSFNATVVGTLFKNIPEINCTFGIDDVKIDIPKTKKSISQLNLDGFFKSGNSADFSKAHLKIEKASAQLPGGEFSGSFNISNFQKPKFDIHYNLKTDIDGFHNIFNISMLDSLSGNLEVTSNLSGKYFPEKKQIGEKNGNSVVKCNNISFVIPGINYIQNVDGIIKFDYDTLQFDNFGLEIGTSDFNIDGYLTNVFYLLIDKDKIIEGDLNIISGTYDFPNFFTYDQRVAKSFPYKFKDANINVGVSTSTQKLLEFEIVPHIDFDIKYLNTEIEDFLPPITINSGLFTLSEIDTALNLDFSNFNITMAGSELVADVVYNSPRVNPDWLTVDVDVSNLNPQKAFVNWFSDSIPSYLSGNIDGAMYLDLVFSLDTIDFDTLNFIANEVNFRNVTDTIEINQFKLVAIDVDYSLSSSVNIMETLNSEMELVISQLTTNSFKVDGLDYDIKIEKGNYYISPNNNQFFNRKGEGLFVIKPFEEKPAFDIKYKVEQFDVARLFSTFLEDTIIKGQMSLNLDFTFEGSDRKEIEQSLEGKLLISGKDLTLFGLDLDKVIDRFKRSQRFTIADVGAVALMGPAGILVTKGTDYASLIVLNSGESCEVVEFSSDWEVANGLVKLADVAFTTNENRMAITGQVNLLSDSLNIGIGLLNKKGCSIYSQSISGDISKPDMGKVKIVKSLLAPVTNLVSNVGEVECDVFYDGKVKQPEK